MLCRVAGWAEHRRGCDGETCVDSTWNGMLGGGWFMTIVAAFV